MNQSKIQPTTTHNRLPRMARQIKKVWSNYKKYLEKYTRETSQSANELLRELTTNIF